MILHFFKTNSKVFIRKIERANQRKSNVKPTQEQLLISQKILNKHWAFQKCHSLLKLAIFITDHQPNQAVGICKTLLLHLVDNSGMINLFALQQESEIHQVESHRAFFESLTSGFLNKHLVFLVFSL